MAESEEEIKSLLVKVKEESEKAGLKLNIKKWRSWHPAPWLHGKLMGKQWREWQILFSWAPKSLHDWGHDINRHLLLGRKAMTNPDSISKSRDITLLTNIHLVKAMIFPCMYERVWPERKLGAEELMLLNLVLKRTLESPLDCKEIKRVNPKEIHS